MISDYQTAKQNFLAGQPNGCREFFAQNGYLLEAGYCEMIADNLDAAKRLFAIVKDIDIRAHWGLYLVSMIQRNANICPTYFELRNFLEPDLNILITYCKGEYVRNILDYTHFMSKINPEIFKFIGRVFYKNGLKDEAGYLFHLAKDSFYNDPELHYLIACMYLDSGNKQMALHYAKTCQKVLPEYFPAVKLEKTLQSVV